MLGRLRVLGDLLGDDHHVMRRHHGRVQLVAANGVDSVDETLNHLGGVVEYPIDFVDQPFFHYFRFFQI